MEFKLFSSYSNELYSLIEKMAGKFGVAEQEVLWRLLSKIEQDLVKLKEVCFVS